MVRLYELFDHRLAPAKVCWPAITNFFYDNARIILLFLAVEQAGCKDMIALEPALPQSYYWSRNLFKSVNVKPLKQIFNTFFFYIQRVILLYTVSYFLLTVNYF